MASGERLLADLLGITNVATESLSALKVEGQTTRNDNNKPEIDVSESITSSPLEPEDIKRVQDEQEVSFDTTKHGDGFVSVSDAFDKSRSAEVKMPLNLLKPIDSNADASSRESSSVDSSGRIQTPEAADMLKSGVFVSSGLQMDAPAILGLAEGQKNQTVNSHKHHIKGNFGLKQGTERLNAKQDTPEPEEKEILVWQFPEGQKKSVLQEKFKNRLQNAAPVKKKVVPRIVASEKVGNQNSSKGDKAEICPTVKPEKDAVQSSSANEAVSYAAIATSTAIAPFLQIQNALEGTISGLVNTLGMAHEAQEKFKSRLQDKRIEELENRILDILDRRLANSGKSVPQAQQWNLERESKMTPSRKLVTNSDVGPVSKTPIEVPSPVQDYMAELQMVPTRDVHNSEKTSSPIPPAAGARPLLAAGQSFSKFHKETQSIPRSWPMPAKLFDKSTSPHQEIMHLKNAKTQTSSSESSVLSEKSLLETPLPRSKIPVPFSRNTPKKYGSRGERMKRSVENRNELLKKLLKGSRQSKAAGKENAPPDEILKNSLLNKSTRGGPIITREHRIDQDEKATKTLKKTENEEDPQMTIIKKLDGFSNLPAPIDRYLVYPVRDEDQQFKNISSSTKVPAEGASGHVTGNRDQGSRTGGHHVAINRVLSEVQQRRERLETNLGALVRRSDQQRLYEFIDRQQSGGTSDLQRIQFEVDKKIDEISTQIQKEAKEPKRSLPQASAVDEKQKKAPQRTKQKTVAVASKQKAKDGTQAKTSKSRKSSEQRDKPKRKAVGKTEVTNASQPQMAVKPSFHDADLLAALLGPRANNAHRSTVRPPHIQFHSPAKPPPAPKRLPTGPQESHAHDNPGRTKSQKKENDETFQCSDKPKYYFQPSEPNFYGLGRFEYPSSGELVPVAKALGKPRQNEELRLAIPSEDIHVPAKNTSPPRLVSQSNVAMVAINDDKSPDNKKDKKKQANLVIQNLPNLVIESAQTDLDNEKSSKEVMDSSAPTTPPKSNEYADFQKYIVCTDIIEEEAEDEGLQDADRAVRFEGSAGKELPEYNEPRFPPERPRCEVNSPGVKIQYKTTVEEKAQEWIEHELLARIVNQMSRPEDPTAGPPNRDHDSEASDSDEDIEEEADWIQEILGPGGVQLCIDAGIPLNKDILEDIVRDVVAEKIVSLLGYQNAAKTPAKKSVSQDELVSDVPTNVFTPLATPDYTPVHSEAPEVHTPTLSSFSEESTRDGHLRLDEEEHKSITFEKEDSHKTADVYVKVSTPPQTPPISESPVGRNINVETPVSSLREDATQAGLPEVQTPELSKAELTPQMLGDFESTQSLSKDVEEEAETIRSPQESKHSALPRLLLPPPQQTVHVMPKVATSVQNSSFTVSSSTAGTSMFEGISDGERLWSDDVIPGLYSEGECPVSEGQVLDLLKEEGDGDLETNFKDLLQNLLGRKRGTITEIPGDISATLRDTEDLNEDTLEEVSISEGEFLANGGYIDPMAKLLNQIRSPTNVTGQKDRVISEGELSGGEYMEVNQNKDSLLIKNGAALPTEGIRGRILSAGEMASSETNESRAQSYSIGEVKTLPSNHGHSISKEMASRARINSHDIEAKDVSDDEKAIVEKDQEQKKLNGKEEFILDGRLKAKSHQLDQDAGRDIEKPRTILVQSGNFDTMSSFNFTDSLNEQRLDSFKEQKLDSLIEEEAMDETTEPVSDAEQAPIIKPGDNLAPTKITLMIPSVADEDSSGELTLEGDDLYSHDDISNLSL